MIVKCEHERFSGHQEHFTAAKRATWPGNEWDNSVYNVPLLKMTLNPICLMTLMDRGLLAHHSSIDAWAYYGSMVPHLRVAGHFLIVDAQPCAVVSVVDPLSEASGVPAQ